MSTTEENLIVSSNFITAINQIGWEKNQPFQGGDYHCCKPALCQSLVCEIHYKIWKYKTHWVDLQGAADTLEHAREKMRFV